ncbi:MAG TPA: hypothetical protein VNK89_00565 [Thermoflexus sp.]|nr:hypothetical protein [Thermoflexus sp.]
MRILRWIGAVLFGLAGCVLAFLSVGGALATLQQRYEAWWGFLLLGLPLAAVLLGTAWALGAGQRVRPVVGTLLAIAALVYTLALAGITIAASTAVARARDLFAGLAFVPAAMFWPAPVLLTALAGALLWKQGMRLAPYLLTGIALGWLTGWAGLWVVLLGSASPPSPVNRLSRVAEPSGWESWAYRLGLLIHPEAWPAHLFFLLPAALALGLGVLGSRRR